MTTSRELQLMKQAFGNVESLMKEVKENLFIPKRFRKEVFTATLRDDYVAYLQRECADLHRRIEAAQQASGRPMVQVGKRVTPNAVPSSEGGIQ